MAALVLFIVACSAPAAPTAAPPTSAGAAPGMLGAEQVTAAPAQPTAASAPTRAARPPQGAAQPTAAPAGVEPNPADDPAAVAAANALGVDRRLVKNAQLTVTVEDTNSAITRFTGIAADVGGYVVSNRLFSDNRRRGATLVLAVPVERFDEALNRVRQVPLQVNQDFISTNDVTDQFVDLEARLKNLQATAERIRALLDRATTVEEALKINTQLSEIESQIEQIKGQLNVLTARTTFSTITIDLREPLPTPTATATFTPTPTPTPVDWRPGETLERAVRAQSTLARLAGDALIWFAVVVLPYGVLLAVVLLIVNRFRPRKTPRSP